MGAICLLQDFFFFFQTSHKINLYFFFSFLTIIIDTHNLRLGKQINVRQLCLYLAVKRVNLPNQLYWRKINMAKVNLEEWKWNFTLYKELMYRLVLFLTDSEIETFTGYWIKDPC